MALSLLVSNWRPYFTPIAVVFLLVSLLWRYLAKNKEIDVPLLTDDGNDFHKIMDEGYKLVSQYHSLSSLFIINILSLMNSEANNGQNIA